MNCLCTGMSSKRIFSLFRSPLVFAFCKNPRPLKKYGNIVCVIEHDLVLQGKSDFLFRTVFAFLRASAKVRKDILQSFPAASLAALSPGSRQRKSEFLFRTSSRFPAGVSRLRTKSTSSSIKNFLCTFPWPR